VARLPKSIGNGDGAPQLTWSIVIAGILAFCALSGGFFAIVQNQFNAQDRRIDAHEKAIEMIRSQYLGLREHAAFQHEQETVNSSFTSRFIALENVQRELVGHAAYSPVEAKEVDVLSAAIDKRFDAAQQQINDINRQIAAAILIQPQGYAHPQSLPQPTH
jgi:hypothetical protein